MAEMPNVVTGETIESEWGNAIRDRTVQRYATVTERATLHPSPTEGDLAYMEDVNTVDVFDGLAWRPLSVSQSIVIGRAFSPSGTSGLTGTFQAQVSETFTKPANWNTYAVLAWGRCSATAAANGIAEVRLTIGGTSGDVVSLSILGNASNTSILFAGHERTGLTGDTTISLDGRATSGSPDIGNADVHYIVIRLT